MKQIFKWNAQVSVDVHRVWVEDGFDMSERIEEIEEALRNMLPWANSGEVAVRVKITKSPTKEEINLARRGE